MATTSASPIRSAMMGALHIGGPVINRSAPHTAQLIPAQVAGIFRITIQHYDFHCSSLLIFYHAYHVSLAFCPRTAGFLSNLFTARGLLLILHDNGTLVVTESKFISLFSYIFPKDGAVCLFQKQRPSPLSKR